MAQSFNKVILLGRLSRDPELLDTKTGKKVGRFTVAVDNYGENAGASFFDCTAWEKSAETIAKYASRGSQILIEGQLKQDTWEQDGQKCSKVGIVVRSFQFLSNATPKSRDEQVADAAEAAMDSGEELNYGEIPF